MSNTLSKRDRGVTTPHAARASGGPAMTATPSAPVLEHPVMTATQGMLLILNAASLRRLPMPFAVRAYDYTPVVQLQFYTRAEVVTWAAALEVAEVIDDRHDSRAGMNDTTRFAATWLDVPICCMASVLREPSGVAS